MGTLLMVPERLRLRLRLPATATMRGLVIHLWCVHVQDRLTAQELGGTSPTWLATINIEPSLLVEKYIGPVGHGPASHVMTSWTF